MEAQPESTLELTAADLLPAHREKPPQDPRFFHFSRKPIDFHTATLIKFIRPNGSVYIIKDLYSRMQKKTP